MNNSMLWDRFHELSSKEFTHALKNHFRDLRPDVNYPAVDFLDAGLPLDMFDVSKDFLANLVRVSVPMALRLSVGVATEQLNSERHNDVLAIVLLFREAIVEMFAEIDSTELGGMSLYSFAESLLNRASRIQSFKDSVARTAGRAAPRS